MKRRAKKQFYDNDTHGSWAVSYGDMITLLLSFFVIFFSFDYNKENEVKLELNAIKNISLVDSSKETSNGLEENSTDTIEELNEITTVVKKEQDGKLIVMFKGANFFDSGFVELNGIGKNLLDKFVQRYLPYAGKFKVKIQAFTDDRPVLTQTKRYRDNVELSALRSISVMKYLQLNGVPLNRVEIGGKGVLSESAYSALGIETSDKDEIRKMSRTIAFVLYREDAS